MPSRKLRCEAVLMKALAVFDLTDILAGRRPHHAGTNNSNDPSRALPMAIDLRMCFFLTYMKLKKKKSSSFW